MPPHNQTPMETEVKQLTDEWHQLRKGKFTGSEIWKLMVEPKAKSETFSETAKTYIMEKIAETFSVEDSPKFSAAATDWGITNEPLAKKWYERRTGNKLTDIGYIPLEGMERYAGGSPDGIVEYRNLVEIKCPYNQSNHIRYILTTPDEFKRECKEYYWQMQFYMLCLSLPHCDFVSFDPRIDADWGLHIKRINRNDTDCELMRGKITAAVEYMTDVISKINEA